MGEHTEGKALRVWADFSGLFSELFYLTETHPLTS
jgi:hypothetical protein